MSDDALVGIVLGIFYLLILFATFALGWFLGRAHEWRITLRRDELARSRAQDITRQHGYDDLEMRGRMN